MAVFCVVIVKPYRFKWSISIGIFAELFSIFSNENILMYLCSSTLKQDNNVNSLFGQVYALL